MFVHTFNILKTASLKETKDYLSVGFKEMRNEIESIESTTELRYFLVNKSSFTDYNIMEYLAESLQLANAQNHLNEYTTFRDRMYEKILQENFAIAAIAQYIKDHETKVCLHSESLLMISLFVSNFVIFHRLSL